MLLSLLDFLIFFLRLNHMFIIHLSVNGHLAIMDSGVMNMRMLKSIPDPSIYMQQDTI